MAQGELDLRSQFRNFSRFGDEESDGKLITIQNLDKWFIQANVVDMDRVTLTDTGVCFFKYKKRKINFSQFQDFLQKISQRTGVPYKEMKEKLEQCGLPGTAKPAKTNQ